MPAWLKLTLDTGGQGTIAVGDSVTDGASGTGTVMAQDSTYWYVLVTGGTSWADSGTITKDINNSKPYSAKADTAGLTLTYGSGGTYAGFDRFGRVVDQKWTKSAGPIMDRFEYGYDRSSNRIWRDVAREVPGGATDKDEFYTYDGLHRLATADRGDLTGSPYSGIGTKNFTQQWTKTESGTPVAELDALGNWRKLRQDTTGNGSFDGSDDMTQTRTNNAVNELTGFTALAAPPDPAQAAWTSPAYDAAGNMVSRPYVASSPRAPAFPAMNRWANLGDPYGTDTNRSA